MASLGCNTVNVEINGPGISNRTISCAFTTLPITLLDFDAQQEDDAVGIDWTTATERNNAFFTVERSADGEAYEAVTEVPGAINSQHAIHYRTVDEHPYNGLSYYRLKQTDLDGTSKYSNEVVVQLKLTDDVLTAYPNPSNTDAFTLAGDLTGGRVDILNTAGAVLYSSTLTGSRVQHPHLEPGVYLVQVTDANGMRRRTVRLAQE